MKVARAANGRMVAVEVKAWDPQAHPRDKNGKFAHIGASVRMADGKTGIISKVAGDGKITVTDTNGSKHDVEANTVRVTRTPRPVETMGTGEHQASVSHGVDSNGKRVLVGDEVTHNGRRLRVRSIETNDDGTHTIHVDATPSLGTTAGNDLRYNIADSTSATRTGKKPKPARPAASAPGEAEPATPSRTSAPARPAPAKRQAPNRNGRTGLSPATAPTPTDDPATPDPTPPTSGGSRSTSGGSSRVRSTSTTRTTGGTNSRGETIRRGQQVRTPHGNGTVRSVRGGRANVQTSNGVISVAIELIRRVAQAFTNRRDKREAAVHERHHAARRAARTTNTAGLEVDEQPSLYIPGYKVIRQGGRLIAIPVPESKAAGRAHAWEENLHPRGRGGKFIKKGDSVLLPTGHGRGTVTGINSDGTVDVRADKGGKIVRVRAATVTRSTHEDRAADKDADAKSLLSRIDSGEDPETAAAAVRRERNKARAKDSRERLASMDNARLRDVRATARTEAAKPKGGRDFAGEYRAAAHDSHATDDLAKRGAAWQRMEKIAKDADHAGVDLNELDLAEEGRVHAVNGTKPPKPGTPESRTNTSPNPRGDGKETLMVNPSEIRKGDQYDMFHKQEDGTYGQVTGEVTALGSSSHPITGATSRTATIKAEDGTTQTITLMGGRHKVTRPLEGGTDAPAVPAEQPQVPNNPVALYDAKTGPRARNGAGAVTDGAWQDKLNDTKGETVQVRGLTVDGRFIEHGIAAKDGGGNAVLVETRGPEPSQAERRRLDTALAGIGENGNGEHVTLLAGVGAPHAALQAGTEEPLPAGKGWEHRDGGALKKGDIIRWQGTDYAVVSGSTMEPLDGDPVNAIPNEQGSEALPGKGMLVAARKERFGMMPESEVDAAFENVMADDNETNSRSAGYWSLAAGLFTDHGSSLGWFDEWERQSMAAESAKAKKRAAKQGSEQQLREEFDTYMADYTARALADPDVKGEFFSTKGKQAKTGYQGDEEQFLREPRQVIAKHASEELKGWIAREGGRMTFAEFKARARGKALTGKEDAGRFRGNDISMSI